MWDRDNGGLHRLLGSSSLSLSDIVSYLEKKEEVREARAKQALRYPIFNRSVLRINRSFLTLTHTSGMSYSSVCAHTCGSQRVCNTSHAHKHTRIKLQGGGVGICTPTDASAATSTSLCIANSLTIYARDLPLVLSGARALVKFDTSTNTSAARQMAAIKAASLEEEGEDAEDKILVPDVHELADEELVVQVILFVGVRSFFVAV